MNDKFSLKRLLAYAKIHYFENRKIYLIYSVILALIMYLFMVEYMFNHNTSYTFTSDKNRDFVVQFWWMLPISIIMLTYLSMKDMNAKIGSLHTLLQPVSVKERYTFTMFNSLFVAIVLHTALFAISCHFAEQKYILGDDFTAHIGIFSRPLAVYYEQGEVFNFDFSNLFPIREMINESGHKIFFTMVITFSAGFIMLHSICMWGMVSIRKYGIPVAMLMHAALYTVIILTINWLMTDVLVDHFHRSYVSYGGGDKTAEMSIIYDTTRWMIDNPLLIALVYIFPITYQIVIWRKMGTKQIKN